jgi:hypothetical protein
VVTTPATEPYVRPRDRPDDPHRDIRARVALFDIAFTRMVGDETGNLDLPFVPYPILRRATACAWSDLVAELVALGKSAVISGGKMYAPSDARRDLDLGEISEDQHLYASQITRVDSVLDLDAIDAPPPPKPKLPEHLGSVEFLSERIGWPQVADRLWLKGSFAWVNDAYSRYGWEAINAGRVRGVLVDE